MVEQIPTENHNVRFQGVNLVGNLARMADVIVLTEMRIGEKYDLARLGHLIALYVHRAHDKHVRFYPVRIGQQAHACQTQQKQGQKHPANPSEHSIFLSDSFIISDCQFT